MIGGFRSVLCVSVFQSSFPVIVIMTDGSEKRICGGGFWTSMLACFWKAERSNLTKKLLHYDDKITVSCSTNMFPEHFFQAWHQMLQTTKINLKKSVSLIFFFKNHSCNPLQSSSSLSTHACFYFIFAVLYPLFMFWAQAMFMFHSVWCQFLLRSLTL